MSGKSAVGAKLLAELNSKDGTVRAAAHRIMANVQNELNKRVDIVMDIQTRGGEQHPGQGLGGPVRAASCTSSASTGRKSSHRPSVGPLSGRSA